MSFDFKKLGVDRVALNIAKTVGAGSGENPVTGDITRGTVVSVQVSSGSGEASVGDRKTGAVPLSANLDSTNEAWNWGIEGSTLTVSTTAGTPSGTLTFWVF